MKSNDETADAFTIFIEEYLEEAMQIAVLGPPDSGQRHAMNVLDHLGVAEGPDASELHTEIFRTLNADWNRVSGISPNQLSEADHACFLDRIREIVRQMPPDADWHLSDPRICFLLPLWGRRWRSPFAFSSTGIRFISPGGSTNNTAIHMPSARRSGNAIYGRRCDICGMCRA